MAVTSSRKPSIDTWFLSRTPRAPLCRALSSVRSQFAFVMNRIGFLENFRIFANFSPPLTRTYGKFFQNFPEIYFIVAQGELGLGTPFIFDKQTAQKTSPVMRSVWLGVPQFQSGLQSLLCTLRFSTAQKTLKKRADLAHPRCAPIHRVTSSPSISMPTCAKRGQRHESEPNAPRSVVYLSPETLFASTSGYRSFTGIGL